MPFSGKQWVSQFPSSKSINDLVDPFRTNAQRFVAALRQAQATVEIADTFRPPERAYLMHFSFAIARENAPLDQIPAQPGVDIQWVHVDAAGQPDIAASRAAAEQMVEGYGIVFKPALETRHTQRKAIDMTITWQNDLAITDGNGATVTISSTPRTGADNSDLHKVGSSYGVIKLLSDHPHWSSDGH